MQFKLDADDKYEIVNKLRITSSNSSGIAKYNIPLNIGIGDKIAKPG